MPDQAAGKKNLRSSNSTYAKPCGARTLGYPCLSLWCSLSHAYAVKSEYKQCTVMTGGVNRPLVREDRRTIYISNTKNVSYIDF
jgi:hypothetical protein